MEYLLSFIVAVAARLVGDRVSKWLDGYKKSDKQPRMEKTGVAAPVFSFACITQYLLSWLL